MLSHPFCTYHASSLHSCFNFISHVLCPSLSSAYTVAKYRAHTLRWFNARYRHPFHSSLLFVMLFVIQYWCERVKRVDAAIAADHKRGVPSDDPGPLPGRAAGRGAPTAARRQRASYRGAARSRGRAAPAAFRPRPLHWDYHQVDVHRDDGHARHR